MTDTTYDWKKAASAVLNNEETEREFANQAYSAVAQRAGKLLAPPHFLGFEMIYSSEEKNRNVGIFAFRVERQLFYAPVFFLNGNIKGQELLYRVGPSLFVPLTEGWVKEITKDAQKSGGGEGQNRQRLNRLPTGTDLSPLIFPRRVKSSSFVLDCINPEAGREAMIAEVIADMTSMEKHANYVPGQLLRKFLVEDGGRQGIGYLEDMIKSSSFFAEAIMQAIDGDLDMIIPPEVLNAPEVVKEASAPARPMLAIHTGGVKNAAVTKEALPDMLKVGFAIEDNRDTGKLSTVFEDIGNWEEANSPGVYDLPTIDAKSGQAMVIMTTPLGGADLGSPGGAPCGSLSCQDDYPQDNRGFLFLSPDATWLPPVDYGHPRSVMGHITAATLESVVEPKGKSSPSSGKAYVIYDTRHKTAARQAYFIADVSTAVTGVKSVVAMPITNERINQWSAVELILNPDAPRIDWKRGILNSDVIFIPVDMTEAPSAQSDLAVACGKTVTVPAKRLASPPSLMPAAAVVEELARGNLSHGYLTKRINDGRFEVKMSSQPLAVFDELKSAAAYMACDLKMPGDVVMELIMGLAEGEKSEFFLQPALTEKNAYGVTRLTEHPNFTTEYDAVLGVPMEEPQSFTLNTETNDPPIREVPLNETWDPSGGRQNNHARIKDPESLDNETLLRASPEEIAQLKQTKDLPFAFEHGVLTGMVKAFDASAMLDKYEPALETGLDRMGRTIFLFYWKPQDMEKAFGVDDMADKEQELISCFKALGDLILSLKQRNYNEQDGTPSLGK